MLADILRVLPKRARGVTRRTVRDSQRWRLLESMTEAVARRGYAEATVAEVIEIAGVSRKTFYEHFRDKEDCFLKAYEILSDRLVIAMKSAIE
ncbi:MAG TPA: helix-turn-helix domain-containing protein, partial [Kofleriaceae bacterium]